MTRTANGTRSSWPPYVLDPQDRSELEALCAEYCWRVDNYFSAEVPDLFTQDGSWEAPGVEVTGRDELHRYWTSRADAARSRTTRHMIATQRFVRGTEGEAFGVITFTLFSAPRGAVASPTPLLVGEHHDTYARQPDGHWLFRSRRVQPLMPNDWRPR